MLEIVSNKIEVLRYLTTDEMNVKLNWESSLKTFFRWKCNLRSGPILEVLIHSLLRLSLNVGPDTNSHKFVLTAARFWPQRWLAVGISGSWKHLFLAWLFLRMIRRWRREGSILLSFLLFYGLMVGKYALICAMEIKKIEMVDHIFPGFRKNIAPLFKELL